MTYIFCGKGTNLLCTFLIILALGGLITEASLF